MDKLATLYFDCFSGAAGDMIVGALIDLGVPLDEIRRALGSLAIAPDTVWTERVTRAGLAATKFSVRGEGRPLDEAHDHDHHHHDAQRHPHDREHEHEHEHHDHSHGHPHHHHDDATTHPHDHAAAVGGEEVHHHVHRTLADIYRLIDGSALTPAGKDRAKGLFERLGEAEAAVHGTTLDRVHLHEVGALDSIVDIVGAVHALEWLNPGRVMASPLNVGGGSIRSAHGVYPVPAPATARLLAGVPVYAGAKKVELVTPTGALLIAGYAAEFGPLPPMRVEKIGYGAGTRDFDDTPNVVRVLLGEAVVAAPTESVVVVEAEIDDMNPQIFGVLMDRLLADGALDVFYTAIQMKKNRPGTLLTVIAPPAVRDRLTSTIFRETTTIGVRYREMARERLDREIVTVQTALGGVRIKVARRNGELLNASPEFDDCAALAARSGRPVKDVHAAAMKAFLDQPSTR